MRWLAEEVAAATGGRVDPAATGGRVDPARPPPAWSQVVIDSRRSVADSLFVPIRAERDGHDWIPEAVAGGATGYLHERGRGREGGGPGATAIEVDDTRAALLDLGRAARRRLSGAVVGVTGSVGKTSTKDLLAAAIGLARRVSANPHSFNNELGVPITLANAPDDTEVAVIEMGARGPGHIALLCEVARPTVGVVTAVAAAHTEVFGSIEGVAAAKGELIEALPADGLAVLNADDPRVAAMAALAGAPVLTYSATGRSGADTVADEVTVGADLRPSFTLRSPWGAARVDLGVRGAHQVANALAAAVVALAVGCDLESVVAGLGAASLSPWRMDLRRAPGGALVLNDAYNANPASMAAALRALAELPAHRRLAVLGEMAELGDTAADAHRGVVELAASLGVDVVAVGTDAYGRTGVGADEVVALLGRLGAGDAVLVKASRTVGLERVAAALLTGS